MKEEIEQLINWYKNEIIKLENDMHSSPSMLVARIEAYKEFIVDLQSLQSKAK